MEIWFINIACSLIAVIIVAWLKKIKKNKTLMRLFINVKDEFLIFKSTSKTYEELSNSALIFENIKGIWRGKSGFLYLECVDGQVYGEYDWKKNSKIGTLKGKVIANDLIIFSWSWKQSLDTGHGFFQIKGDHLVGGWFFDKNYLKLMQMDRKNNVNSLFPWSFRKHDTTKLSALNTE